MFRSNQVQGAHKYLYNVVLRKYVVAKEIYIPKVCTSFHNQHNLYHFAKIIT